MHTTGISCFGIQCAFKHTAEYSRGNIGPVYAGRYLINDKMNDLIGKAGYLYIFFRKQSAVDIWKCVKIIIYIRVTGIVRSIEHTEKLYQLVSYLLCGKL